jgi:hypothetical protein
MSRLLLLSLWNVFRVSAAAEAVASPRAMRSARGEEASENAAIIRTRGGVDLNIEQSWYRGASNIAEVTRGSGEVDVGGTLPHFTRSPGASASRHIDVDSAQTDGNAVTSLSRGAKESPTSTQYATPTPTVRYASFCVQVVFTPQVLSGQQTGKNYPSKYRCNSTKLTNETSGVDQADCENDCLNNEECQSYNYLDNAKKCTLHSGINITGPDSAAICWVKGTNIPPTPAPTTEGSFRGTMVGNYKFRCNSHNLTGDMDNKNQTTCEEECLNWPNNACQSYNYNYHEKCRLHSGITVHNGNDGQATCWVRAGALD